MNACRKCFTTLILFFVLLCPVICWAEGFFDEGDSFGGHVKLRGAALFPAEGTVYGDESALYDASIENRLKFSVDRGPWRLEAHAETLVQAGDSRKAVMKSLQPFHITGETLSRYISATDDDRRFFDLTYSHDMGGNEDARLTSRIDRLLLGYSADWGSAVIGRNAVTWGNGLAFNPMDLFNPFAPSDIEREYKIGDDMVLIRGLLSGGNEIQLLAVPRRDPGTNDIDGGQSSFAGKFHFFSGAFEGDLMAAVHYGEKVAGLGATGYLGEAAWRMDGVFTAGKDDTPDFFTFVANMDYSWVFLEKNFYGFIEYYFNGLSHDDYREVKGGTLPGPLYDRIMRGDMHTLGRNYLAISMTFEMHPLVNLYITDITNLSGPSGMLTPRMTVSLTQNTELTAGMNMYYGESGTEFGGYRLSGDPFITKAGANAFVWLACYF